MNAQEFIKHIEEESKKRLQEILDRKNKDGLTVNLILDVYRYFGSDINNTVKHLLEDKTEVDYNANVYKIKCVINDKIANNLKEFEEIKQRALRNDSTLDGKWEDEPLPEKVYGVAEDFDEFLNVFLNENINIWSEFPQPKEELNEMLNQIKPYFIGFLTLHTFIYNHKSYDCKTVILSRDELVNYCSNLNNCLLYGVYLLKAPDKFKLRYAQVEQVK